MRRPRRNHSAKFKSKVAPAALKGEQTIALKRSGASLRGHIIPFCRTLRQTAKFDRLPGRKSQAKFAQYKTLSFKPIQKFFPKTLPVVKRY